MKIEALLSPEAVFVQLHARDKKQALKLMAAHAAPISGLSEKEIYTVLQQREGRGSTCMGGGVCIPHGRFEKLASIRACFAQFHAPVDYVSPDGKAVDIMFLLLTPMHADTEHLKALSLISKLLRNKSLCEQLRKAPDPASAYALLLAASREDAA